jgi:hypothetical protein
MLRTAKSEIARLAIEHVRRRPRDTVYRLDVGSARADPENTTDRMAFLMLPTGQPKVAANEEKASHEAHSKRRRGLWG